MAPPAPRVIPAGEFTGTVEDQLKAEKLKQAGFLTNRLELEDGARKGKYMDTMEASSAMHRIAE
jgi:hypothetical protein